MDVGGESWTDERITLLKALWADGLSAGQIAGELGGITRNAVIGKVHRLGLVGRAARTPRAASTPRAPRYVPRPAVRQSGDFPPVAPEPEPPAVVDDLEIPAEQRRTLLQLTPDTCRWPIGEPSTPDFYFCGAKPGDGVYCPHHARIAYNGIPAQRRVDPPPRRNY